ncbi:hypothetical protein ACHAXR_004497 [Thalassiosira sp. AJA248-18]
MSAFTRRPSSAGGTVKKHSQNQYHTQRESFLCTSRETICSRHFGSKSMQQQFLKTTKTKSRANDEDNGEDLEREDDEEEEEEEEAGSHNNYQPTDNVIKSRTLDWIKKVVIGYNLCPFAERPLREDKLKVSVVRGSDDEYVASAVVYELIARSEESQSGTTVVVAPEYYPDDFVGYMNLVQWIEDNIFDEHELDGLVQIAPFHPKFEFAGSGNEGIDNFTNRSPYPMFHILREDEVGGAVEKLGGDASKVWSRNVRLLESMEEKWGAVGVEKAMRGEPMDGMDALLKEMKLSDRDNDRD